MTTLPWLAGLEITVCHTEYVPGTDSQLHQPKNTSSKLQQADTDRS